ncbi:hypothetical protein [Lysinibacillus xylanilyticus]|uniref:hypothetical protein n=1 Tax=Lysinibacillus xylanilyticus TaxID=582475 RepID=UPI0009F3DB41|nr:hypothetical protein [Lysinibacillus xylanilyticus]
MKNKKTFRIISIMILIIALLITAYKFDESKNNLVEMLKIQDTVYVVTGEPVEKSQVVRKLGEIKQKIDRNQVPNTNFESNSLNEGTPIYERKNGDGFPKSVVYKREGKFYIATQVVNLNRSD